MGQITDLPGITVGHSTNTKYQTGCTVLLCENKAVAGVDVRGSAPGTTEIEVLKPVRLVPKIDGIYFTGGSALGLSSVKGVLNYLRENGIGYNTGSANIPIIPGAVIYDIQKDVDEAIPTIEMAYEAAKTATSGAIEEGSVGVGAGATVGNIHGPSETHRGGFATLSSTTSDGILVGVMVVANPFGGILNPWKNQWLVGKASLEKSMLYHRPDDLWESNTTLVAIATDARLTKEQCTKVAQMAQDGVARVINPAHTMFDGDISIAMSVGVKTGELNGIGHLAADLTAQCILRAVELSNDDIVL